MQATVLENFCCEGDKIWQKGEIFSGKDELVAELAAKKLVEPIVVAKVEVEKKPAKKK